MWKRWLTGLAAAGLLFAACGGGSSPQGIASLEGSTTAAAADGTTTTAAAVDPEQAMLDFTQCMRDHGVDMPDPQMGPGGGAFGFSIQGEPGDGPAAAEMQEFQDANEACRHILEGMVQEFERPDMSEMQDQMLAFSQCMRDHGIDYPDPEFSEDGGVTMMIGPGQEGGIDPSDPAFQEAQEACNEVFGGGPGGMVITGSVSGGPGGEGSGEGGMVIIGGGGAVPGGGGDDSSGGG